MPYLALPRLAIVVTLLTALPAFAASEPAKTTAKPPVTLLDFTQDPESFGNLIQFAYEGWKGKVQQVRNYGTVVSGAAGKGGMGNNSVTLDFKESTQAELIVLLGDSNEAESFRLTLIDRDGTEATWTLPLTHLAPRNPVVYRLKLAKPDAVEKPGKDSALNQHAIVGWQIKGNWTPAPVTLLVLKLNAVP